MSSVPVVSKVGQFIDGREMPAPGPGRIRPAGHVAVVYFDQRGAHIAYEPNEAQKAWDRKAVRHGR